MKKYIPWVIGGISGLNWLSLRGSLTDVSFCNGLRKLETVDLKNSGVDKLDTKKILTQVKTLLI